MTSAHATTCSTAVDVKVVFVTGAENKTQLTEKNSNHRAFRGQEARHLELQKRLCDYVDDKGQYGCAVNSEMCQLKALAETKELGNTDFKATLHLCQEAANEQVPMASSRDRRSVATANHA